MPIQEMREKHFYAYMICLVEIGDLIKAEKMCEEGIKISHLKYYKHMFNVYKKYFTHKNKKRLNNQIIKAMQIFSSQIDLFEKEFLHMLVAHHYKELGLQKEAYTYLEKILHNSL